MHPNDVHPGVRSIVENPALVDLLLIRQFMAHGGIALPPLKTARDLQTAHEIVAAQEASAGLPWTTGRSAMHHPMCYAAPCSLMITLANNPFRADVKNTPAPPGMGSGRGVSSTRGRGGRGRGERGGGVA